MPQNRTSRRADELVSTESYDISIQEDGKNNLRETGMYGGQDFQDFDEKFSTAFSLTSQWAFWYGKREHTFVNNSISYSFQNSRITTEAREFFYNKKGLNINKGFMTNYQGKEWRIGGGNFGFSGLLMAGGDPMEQMVGSTANYTILSNNKAVVHVITNTTSLKSLLYGLTPECMNWRNTYQTYIFSEPVYTDPELRNFYLKH
jgi:hypothetical protein